MYIGTSQLSVNTRLTEHKRNCRLGYMETFAVTEHAFFGRDHANQFEDTEILSTTNHYHARLQREAIQIFKHPNNFNRREDGLKINSNWYPALQNTKAKLFKDRVAHPRHRAIDIQPGVSPRTIDQSEASAQSLHRCAPLTPTIEADAAQRAPPAASQPPTRIVRPRLCRH